MGCADNSKDENSGVSSDDSQTTVHHHDLDDVIGKMEFVSVPVELQQYPKFEENFKLALLKGIDVAVRIAEGNRWFVNEATNVNALTEIESILISHSQGNTEYFEGDKVDIGISNSNVVTFKKSTGKIHTLNVRINWVKLGPSAAEQSPSSRSFDVHISQNLVLESGNSLDLDISEVIGLGALTGQPKLIALAAAVSQTDITVKKVKFRSYKENGWALMDEKAFKLPTRLGDVSLLTRKVFEKLSRRLCDIHRPTTGGSENCEEPFDDYRPEGESELRDGLLSKARINAQRITEIPHKEFIFPVNSCKKGVNPGTTTLGFHVPEIIANAIATSGNKFYVQQLQKIQAGGSDRKPVKLFRFQGVSADKTATIVEDPEFLNHPICQRFGSPLRLLKGSGTIEKIKTEKVHAASRYTCLIFEIRSKWWGYNGCLDGHLVGTNRIRTDKKAFEEGLFISAFDGKENSAGFEKVDLVSTQQEVGIWDLHKGTLSDNAKLIEGILNASP